MELQAKEEKLQRILRVLGGTVVAFSGGVDSTLLLARALSVLEKERVLAVTAASILHPAAETEEARKLAARLEAEHRVVAAADPAGAPWGANPPDRCYYCKREMYALLWEIARERGLPAVADGANLDDAAGYRPGLKAARELRVRSPLLEAGLDKAAVRELSRRSGLPTWNRPAAACLATRFPYGESLTAEKLKRVEQAEAFLRRAGFVRELRVRSHGPVARIEVPPEELPHLLEQRLAVTAHLRELGFLHVTLDLAGFRSGSMDNLGTGYKLLGEDKLAGKKPSGFCNRNCERDDKNTIR